MVNYGLKDRVILITGANNPWGIGATTALAFAREGAKVDIPWANGEPSYRDGYGNQENFLLLVKNNGIWEYKDSIDDPSAQYNGVIGYIMER